MVLSGTLLLTFLSYQKGTGKKGVLYKLKLMAMVSGGLITFLANIAFSSKNINNFTEIYESAVNNFLPLFYGFFLYFILDLIKVPLPKDTEANYLNSSTEERLEDYDMTLREIVVAREILLNLSNSEIAEKLYISENTVKKHINHIFQKVGVRNRTEFIYKFTSCKNDH
jgi:DNA-binding CsgD family transcriptional regulator